MQRFVKEHTGVVAGEGSAGSVSPVHPGREADDQETSVAVTERRHGAAVIVRIFALNIAKKRS